MHIAILMTNTDESAFALAHPKDGDKFKSLIASQRPEWKSTVYPVKDGAFPADLAAFDGFIITGSPASVHDDQPWVARLMQDIRQIAEQKIPLFGACFGHQAIAMALGGTVGANPGGWVFGQVTTTIADGPIRLYAAHKEQVIDLPKAARALGGNAECAIGGFAIGSHILTTQYHPEMTADFIAALIEELKDALPQAVIAKARASLSELAETERIAKVIVEFLEQSAEQNRYDRAASKSIAVT